MDQPRSKPASRNKKVAKSRMTNPCDPCALRRVRCDGGFPCKDCEKRNLECTRFRPSKKRGPKGPRKSTGDKVRAQQQILSATTTTTHNDTGEPFVFKTLTKRTPTSSEDLETSAFGSPSCSDSTTKLGPEVGPSPPFVPQSLANYCKYLDIFQDRLYSVWPVLCHKTTILLMARDSYDHDTWAMAAAVCAAAISQLRLPEHCCLNVSSPGSVRSSSSARGRRPSSTSQDFAADADYFRKQFDWRESPTISSLLTSFFLHMYYANSERLRSAAFYIRDAITQAQLLRMHRTSSYNTLSASEREVRLRIYWLLFVTERTFIVQQGLPPILEPISLSPSPEETLHGCSFRPILSFLRLTTLFTYLDGDLIELSLMSAVIPQDPDSTNVGYPGPTLSPHSSEGIRQRLLDFQSILGSAAEAPDLDETQRADLAVTRNWIRVILWDCAKWHFSMKSASPRNRAWDMLLPLSVSHDLLALFSGISDNAICAHGYGMEIKVSRIAHSLLEVLLACRPVIEANSMLCRSRDTLHGLEKVLCKVGGVSSVFVHQLRNRMAELDLPVPNSNSNLRLAWMGEYDVVKEDEQKA